MIEFKYKHTQFIEFVKHLSTEGKFMDLRNDLGDFAGATVGDDMSLFYADLYKILYDHFMREQTQKYWRKRFAIELRDLKVEITGVELVDEED